MNEWFVTVAEFKRILPQLYANGYILVDIHDLFQSHDENGHTVLTRRALMLPVGKKPLVLSIDDMNYYTYMRQYGTAYKLVLDAEGNVAAYAVDPQGRQIVSREDAIVPLVDSFVRQHPDFSWDGAKGMIDLTGYQGVLGYRTDRISAPDAARVRKQALAVVRQLKATGWTFACHGWGHLNAATITETTLERDTKRWESEVEPLIGPTDVYVYPFGAGLTPDNSKFHFLESQGFRVFLGVGPEPNLRFTPDFLAMDRVHVDGLALETQPRILARFFSAASVIDLTAREPVWPPVARR